MWANDDKTHWSEEMMDLTVRACSEATLTHGWPPSENIISSCDNDYIFNFHLCCLLNCEQNYEPHREEEWEWERQRIDRIIPHHIVAASRMPGLRQWADNARRMGSVALHLALFAVTRTTSDDICFFFFFDYLTSLLGCVRARCALTLSRQYYINIFRFDEFVTWVY